MFIPSHAMLQISPSGFTLYIMHLFLFMYLVFLRFGAFNGVLSARSSEGAAHLTKALQKGFPTICCCDHELARPLATATFPIN